MDWRDGWPDPDDALGALGIDAGTTVADVGCANAYYTLPAAERVAPATVYAVDTDGIVLDELAAAALDADIGNLETISIGMDMLATGLPEVVDAVLAANTLHRLERPRQFAEQAYRSLTPGGRLLLIDRQVDDPERSMSEPWRGTAADGRLTRDQSEAIITTAAFKLLESIALDPSHYGLVFGRTHDR
ncbi:MAG: class I SAM-dependent methyltransferase [Halobacteriales archaeon]